MSLTVGLGSGSALGPGSAAPPSALPASPTGSRGPKAVWKCLVLKCLARYGSRCPAGIHAAASTARCSARPPTTAPSALASAASLGWAALGPTLLVADVRDGSAPHPSLLAIPAACLAAMLPLQHAGGSDQGSKALSRGYGSVRPVSEALRATC
eukprot:CAMPEP_0173422940 /NCGR_PEP_ID=MMETSP1357-20121228/3450_1 /TAXON_ID=77926 /ORGANISM="Hemiselmis rufescens, Strain PCC563" /LENGTH=153 /DNA_ID=CAMNT_0014386009 /DNA_START=103 /DNA_END=562 /DNA_ORIENTATION=+